MKIKINSFFFLLTDFYHFILTIKEISGFYFPEFSVQVSWFFSNKSANLRNNSNLSIKVSEAINLVLENSKQNF